MVAMCSAIGPDDRCFSVGPMFHAYGLGNSLSFPFAVGASTVLEPTQAAEPGSWSPTSSGTHRPTLFFCIPTFYAALNGSDLPDDTFEPGSGWPPRRPSPSRPRPSSGSGSASG